MNRKIQKKGAIDWSISLFLVLNPTLGLIGAITYYCYFPFQISILIFSLIFAAATNLSITAGYHRLFSHKSYEAHSLIKILYLLVGASAFQGSALKWSADHRIHHSKVDSDLDPYNIHKGFWYAHMGWLFLKNSTDSNPKAADLEKDWMVRFQHNHYFMLAFLTGFAFPLWVGYLIGAPFEGLLIAGALRIALTQQSTFFVNSLCHTLGSKPYSCEVSARDSFLVALLTHGEGYHNFHHQFQIDYRNGVRWYQWDPTKWTIRTLAFFGLAKKLKRISQQEILKARLQVESVRLLSKGYSQDFIEQMRNKILHAQTAYQHLKKEMSLTSKSRIAKIKIEMEVHRIELRSAMKLWQIYLRGPQIEI